MNTLPEIIHLGKYDAAASHKNKMVTPNRRVSLYEIEFILEDGGVSYINDKKHKIYKNSIIIAKPGQLRHTELPFKVMYIHLMTDNHQITELLNSAPDFFADENHKQYKQIISDIITIAAEATPDSKLKTYEKLFSLFTLIYQSTRIHTAGGNFSESNAQTIKKAITFIDENYRENISLAQIAHNAGFSRIYFRNMFVAATGISPTEYLQNKRISKAKELTLTTDKSLMQIAQECGFSSQSYMNFVFRQSEGCSPREYKRKYTYFK